MLKESNPTGVKIMVKILTSSEYGKQSLSL